MKLEKILLCVALLWCALPASAQDKGPLIDAGVKISSAELAGLLPQKQASSFTLLCPADISTVQTSTAVPEGWEVFVDTTNTRHFLESISLYSGHPRDMASLVPDNEGDTSDESSVWTIFPDAGRSYWVSCKYHDTDIMLIKSFVITKSCVVTAKPEVNSVQVDCSANPAADDK